MDKISPGLQSDIDRVKAVLTSAMKNGLPYFMQRISRDFLVLRAYKGYPPVSLTKQPREPDFYPVVEKPIAFAVIGDPLNVMVGKSVENVGFVTVDGPTVAPLQVLFWSYIQDETRIVGRSQAKSMHNSFTR